MKIGPLESKPQAATVATERKAAPAAAAEASAHVELSPAAALLAGGTDGSFDADKVQRIATAIREGRFKVDPDAIADKLIANAQELLGKTGPAR